MINVSILMNARNAEGYLREAIDSIYSQTYTDWEIIFVDNQSTDNTAQIANSYDEKLKYFKTPESYILGEARSFGLSKCDGRYVAFLDTDDLWLPEKLEKQLLGMEKDNVHLSYTGGYYIDSEGARSGVFKPKYKDKDVFGENLKQYEVNQQTIIISQELLQKRLDKNFDITLSHSVDYDFFMRAAYQNKVYVLEEPLVQYRLHEGQLSRQNRSIWHKEGVAVFTKLIQLYPEMLTDYKEEIFINDAKRAYHYAYSLKVEGKFLAPVQALYPFKFVDKKYFFVFLLACLPKCIWEFAHEFKRI